MDTPAQIKTREQRVRRQLRRMGYTLRKSRGKEQGGWLQVVDDRNCLVYPPWTNRQGYAAYGECLEGIEAWLASIPEEKS